jgi:GTP cyclohydrolase I
MSTLVDTQSSADDRNIPIDRVGVRGLRFPLRVRDKDHAEQSTVATVSLSVDLPHHFKGTHMSRFVEVLNSHGRILHVSNIRALCGELKARLEARSAHAAFDFPYFVEKKAPVTGAPGLVDCQARFHATLGPDDIFDFVATVVVGVTTLCPCSKAISARGAHNQRGEVTFSVRFKGLVWIEDLVRIVENSASSELYSLLKRPDEKAVTERAFDNPVFVEDLVRNVAQAAREHPAITWFTVEAENFESIHKHNAFAVVNSGTIAGS